MDNQNERQRDNQNQLYMISGMSLENVRNKYEHIVIQIMKKVIPDFPEFDSCPICLEDVYALSLSRIPATYVSNADFLDAEAADTENTEEIVRYAIFQVMSSPKH